MAFRLHPLDELCVQAPEAQCRKESDVKRLLGLKAQFCALCNAGWQEGALQVGAEQSALSLLKRD